MVIFSNIVRSVWGKEGTDST